MLTQSEYIIFPFFNDITPEWGPRLWTFLNQPGNVRRMSEASDEERPRPAAEAITTPLFLRHLAIASGRIGSSGTSAC